jgi:hypothetical protein
VGEDGYSGRMGLPWRVVPACLVGIAAFAGCGSSKSGECKELVGVINRGIEALEKGQKQEKNDPTRTQELRAMADTADKIAEEASRLELGLPETKSLAQRYHAMLKDISKAAREVADAAEKKDLDRATKGQAVLAEAVRKEEPILDELNKFCAP